LGLVVISTLLLRVFTAVPDTCARSATVSSHGCELTGSAANDDVTLLLTVTEDDMRLARVRLEALLRFQRYDFKERVLVADTHGGAPSRDLHQVLEEIRLAGLVDSWTLVNYSKDYVARVHASAGWWSEHVLNGTAGNLVYFYILDSCRTRFCVHFDLDIVFWSRLSYSWIQVGIGLLRENAQALEVQPPLPGWPPTGVGDTSTDRHTCLSPTFMTARYYLVDADRYRSLLQHAQDDGALLRACGGDRHWEEFVSCLACRVGFSRLDLLDSGSSWVLHFPVDAPPWLLESVLANCVGRGTAVVSSTPYDAAPLAAWLRHPCMRDAFRPPVLGGDSGSGGRSQRRSGASTSGVLRSMSELL